MNKHKIFECEGKQYEVTDIPTDGVPTCHSCALENLMGAAPGCHAVALAATEAGLPDCGDDTGIIYKEVDPLYLDLLKVKEMTDGDGSKI